MTKGFTVTCNECGKQTELTTENYKDYFLYQSWNQPIKFEDVQRINEIIISCEEDEANENIACPCGNKLRGM